MAAYSLLTPNLISSNPITLTLLSFSKPTTTTTSHFSFSSSNSNTSPFLPLSILVKGRGFSGYDTIVRKVAVSSDLEEEDEYLSGGDEEDVRRFSPDLKLFVGNLPFSVDSSDLAELFERAGNVQQVEVIYDKETGRSRGFGFVTMSTTDEVDAAAQQFNGYELQGRAMRVNSGPPPPRREEYPSRGFRSGGGGGGGGGGSFDAGNRVYVGNLSWGVDNSALETLFRGQGKVTEAKVVYDRETGRSRGFGFVTYSTAAEANNAVSSLDGSDLDGRAIRVTVAEDALLLRCIGGSAIGPRTSVLQCDDKWHLQAYTDFAFFIGL